MTNSLFRPVLIAAAAFISLAGCWEPESHDGLQRLEGGARGGPWTSCDDALAAGLSGDSCAFPANLTACGVNRDLSAPDSMDIASCTVDGQLLRNTTDKTDVDPSLPVNVPHHLDDGCIGFQSDPTVYPRDVLCVPDELLGPESTSESIDLDAEGACDSLIEDREPGMACSGESVCGLMLLSPPVSGDGANSDPLFAWCHAGRLRVATAVINYVMDTCPHLRPAGVESYSCTY